MKRRFLQQLHLARQPFAVLCTLLLLLPLLFAVGPRPNQVTAEYIAGLTGYSLCSPTGHTQKGSKELPQHPCENCVAGANCGSCANCLPTIAERLTPKRILAGVLRPDSQLSNQMFVATIYAARAPPTLI